MFMLPTSEATMGVYSVPIKRDRLRGEDQEVQVLEIQPQKQTSNYSVEVLVGQNQHTFSIEVEEAKIGDDTIQVAGGGRYPWETLQYNPRVIGQIDRLVLNVYNGQEVALPVTITEHLPISPLTQKIVAFNGNGHNGHHTSRSRERHESRIMAPF